MLLSRLYPKAGIQGQSGGDNKAGENMVNTDKYLFTQKDGILGPVLHPEIKEKTIKVVFYGKSLASTDNE